MEISYNLFLCWLIILLNVEMCIQTYKLCFMNNGIKIKSIQNCTLVSESI